MSHCIVNQLCKIEHAPIAQNEVKYNANGGTVFFDQRLKELVLNSYQFLSLLGERSITQRSFSKKMKTKYRKTL